VTLSNLRKRKRVGLLVVESAKEGRESEGQLRTSVRRDLAFNANNLFSLGELG